MTSAEILKNALENHGSWEGFFHEICVIQDKQAQKIMQLEIMIKELQRNK